MGLPHLGLGDTPAHKLAQGRFGVAATPTPSVAPVIDNHEAIGRILTRWEVTPRSYRLRSLHNRSPMQSPTMSPLCRALVIKVHIDYGAPL